jgi:hypothetical protein
MLARRANAVRRLSAAATFAAAVFARRSSGEVRAHRRRAASEARDGFVDVLIYGTVAGRAAAVIRAEG